MPRRRTLLARRRTSPCRLSELAVLWLLHPRLQTEKSMAPIAAQAIHHWAPRLEERAKNPQSRGPVKGLIAVSFDQRNHGARMTDKLSNEAWRQGNPRHAQDMFSVYREYPDQAERLRLSFSLVFRL